MIVQQYAVIITDGKTQGRSFTKDGHVIHAGFPVELTKMAHAEYEAEYGEPYNPQLLAQRMCDALNEHEPTTIAHVELIDREREDSSSS